MGRGKGGSTGKLSRKARDKRTDVQKAIDAAAAASKAAWAARHPSAARSERALRKQQVAKIARWKHKNDGTPETHENAARTHQGALAQLHANGTIDNEQLEYAAEIANVHRSIEADVAIAIASLEARVDQSRSMAGTAEGVRRVRFHYAYTLWRDALPTPRALTLDMIVGDAIGYSVAARRYNVHNRKAKRLLLAALDAWPMFVERAYRAVSSDDVHMANAA